MVRKWSDLKQLSPEEMKLRSSVRTRRAEEKDFKAYLKWMQWKFALGLCVLLLLSWGLKQLYRARKTSRPTTQITLEKTVKRKRPSSTWRSLWIKRKGLRRAVPPRNMKVRKKVVPSGPDWMDLAFSGKKKQYGPREFPLSGENVMDLDKLSLEYQQMVEQGKEIDPDIVEAWDFSKSGYYQNALIYYQRALQKTESNNYIVLDFIYGEMAKIYNRLGKKGERSACEYKQHQVRSAVESVVKDSGDFNADEIAMMEEAERNNREKMKHLVNEYRSLPASDKKQFEVKLRNKYGRDLGEKELSKLIDTVKAAATTQ